VAACLPYVLLAIFADFTHVHSAPAGALSPDTTHGPVVAGALNGAAQTGSSCPVCLWLRAGPRLVSQVSVEAAVTTVQSAVTPALGDAPPSPVPHPPAFRGPPRPSFS
jgi:hypothetical protein